MALIATVNGKDTVTIDVSWDMSHIGLYIVPEIMEGILVMLVLMFVSMCFACQLMSIQCPPYFADKSINWGKVEEVE